MHLFEPLLFRLFVVLLLLLPGAELDLILGEQQVDLSAENTGLVHRLDTVRVARVDLDNSADEPLLPWWRLHLDCVWP